MWKLILNKLKNESPLESREHTYLHALPVC